MKFHSTCFLLKAPTSAFTIKNLLGDTKVIPSNLTLPPYRQSLVVPRFCLSCFVCGENYLSARGLKAEPEPAVKILYFIQNHLEIPSDGTVQTVDCGIDEFTRWRQNHVGGL